MSPETAGVDVVERSAILEHVTGLAGVGITAAALVVAGQEERGGVVVIGTQYKYSPVLQVKIVMKIGNSEEGEREKGVERVIKFLR